MRMLPSPRPQAVAVSVATVASPVVAVDTLLDNHMQVVRLLLNTKRN
jgi:hypothetical protein